MDDLVVSVDSCEYLADFVVLQPNSELWGHPLILGRPCMATKNSYIKCRLGSMTIYDGSTIKNINLYLPSKPNLDTETLLCRFRGRRRYLAYINNCESLDL